MLEKDSTCSFYQFLMDEYSKNAKVQIYFLTIFGYFKQCDHLWDIGPFYAIFQLSLIIIPSSANCAKL